MAYTGGPLNELNGKMGISAPGKSVPVMRLIGVHKPKSKDALVGLIKYHYENDCKCGVKSQGTIEDFGKNLYESQTGYWGEYRYPLADCVQWEYDLFVLQSLKGDLVEKKAIQILKKEFPKHQVEEAKGYLDEELRIDILIANNSKEKCGIQVKPDTFNNMRSEVIFFNKKANKKWGKSVFYLFYDRDENFKNLDSVIAKIKNIDK